MGKLQTTISAAIELHFETLLTKNDPVQRVSYQKWYILPEFTKNGPRLI